MRKAREFGWPRYEPMLKSLSLRFLINFSAIAGASYLIAINEGVSIFSIVVPLSLAWAISVWLTDKYRHKYPQRYYSYLLASHGKALLVLASVLMFLLILAPHRYPISFVSLAGVLVTAVDFLLSLPRTRVKGRANLVTTNNKYEVQMPPLESVNTIAIGRELNEAKELILKDGLVPFIIEALGHNRKGAASLNIIDADQVEGIEKVALLLQKKSMNSVRRLNIFLGGLPSAVIMGGYFVFRYKPMDEYLEELKAKKRGLRYIITYGWHFLWRRGIPKIKILERIYFSKTFSWLDSLLYKPRTENRRVIARAEMWGRVYYWGFDVLSERKMGADHWVITRRIQMQEITRKPSFYLVTRLTKVGLDGKLMQLHKLRTMYPFSEFLQERIHRDHGLLNTGKFKNDFRITDYGKIMRRYWLDELPGIWDWLRGEIKLVGMRATSPQFLSLYPRDLYNLYIETKPGLIPPIFGSATRGFDDIVRIELNYLQAYRQRPIATDIKYLFKTLNDIVLRGTRSR